MKKAVLFSMFLGLMVASSGQASVPPPGKVTDDTALHQNLSEITAPRQGRLSFDDDIQRLDKMEGRYRERLPALADRPGIAAPLKRISARKYKAAPRKGSAFSKKR
jgi:hypothetical protein